MVQSCLLFIMEYLIFKNLLHCFSHKDTADNNNNDGYLVSLINYRTLLA